jgi:hypothetical protein
MDEDLKDKLRKKEILTYTRRNKVPLTSPQVAKKDVPQETPTKKDITPPPPTSRDKRKGKPKYDKKSEVLWLGPYIINKNSKKGTYYLSTMDGRKMPLPVDGSILLPYINRT